MLLWSRFGRTSSTSIGASLSASPFIANSSANRRAISFSRGRRAPRYSGGRKNRGNDSAVTTLCMRERGRDARSTCMTCSSLCTPRRDARRIQFRIRDSVDLVSANAPPMCTRTTSSFTLRRDAIRVTISLDQSRSDHDADGNVQKSFANKRDELEGEGGETNSPRESIAIVRICRLSLAEDLIHDSYCLSPSLFFFLSLSSF